jgi:hypothetical protein
MQHIAALREEIEVRGIWVRSTRLVVAGVILLPCVVAYCVPLGWPSWYAPIIALFCYAALAAAFALPAAFLVRRFYQRRIRRFVAALDEQDRAAVLLPLLSSRLADTRKLTSGLIRDFNLSTEISPASEPGARGDEASPAAGPR